jgi:endogenous inhibitor of DNA gyrase (YacG/DUF329 family)
MSPVAHVSPCPACGMPAVWVGTQGARAYSPGGPDGLFVDLPSSITIDCPNCDRQTGDKMLPQVKQRSDGSLVVTASRPQDDIIQILFLSRNDAADVRDRLNYLLDTDPDPKRAA